MDDEPYLAVLVALTISTASILVWSFLLIVIVRSLTAHSEERLVVLAIPTMGILASVGTLASAISFGVVTGVLDIDISTTALRVISSMGRGGLLMGGVIALAYYRPRKAQ